ncbi:prenyltransferase [Liquorilactobacillus capillatus]|uniref:1,4-dihydroxy-2-naphthoate octaprenyltransferase n=1 Tax=Liquorilactobacillus capillatus DSM 19910 TaxID=1423731 RepID=A0A0R1M372_9LACO|nr:prenyltransferase [Liquorilactobacillus capillatus]KRL02476.1 1,4-dihydroxy-2-naphthoate octaprenyltransferase [Liquorilactobacillus capillatus DSM 19910]
MTIPVFLELVEIKAKTASIFPFLLGACYSWFNYRSVHLGLLALFFVAMFIFNMSVDILDNYNDYRHATEVHEYKQKTNIIGREHLVLKEVFILMITMIVISAAIGLGLAYIVGWPLLVVGGFCYLVGIFYSSGPRPLSSLPLGELFSGTTMGFMITLICVYINTYQLFSWDTVTIAQIFLIALPNTLWIANLMLANNICDLEEDEKNQRFTLVHYLGKKNAINLFVLMNIAAIIALITAVYLKIAPWTVLLALIVLPIIIKQVRTFLEKQIKQETFICAVRILAVGALSQTVSFMLYMPFI